MTLSCTLQSLRDVIELGAGGLLTYIEGELRLVVNEERGLDPKKPLGKATSLLEGRLKDIEKTYDATIYLLAVVQQRR